MKKTTLINFKVECDRADRWRKVLKKEGITISDVCRDALDRKVARIEKEAGRVVRKIEKTEGK